MFVAKLERVKAVQTRLKALRDKANRDQNEVVVGFTQVYALKVHEDVQAHHKEGKQAKYLEGPARRYGKEIGELVARVYKQTKSMGKALFVGGLRLLREAQLIVPVDTSALKNSGYVAFAKDADQASADALATSEKIRQQVIQERNSRRKRR